MSEFDFKDRTHEELVNYVEGTIDSLGLVLHATKGVFAKGFIPDVVTNIDGTKNGWILIDVINTKESLLRDIAGLLVVQANIERNGDKVKRIFAVLSDNITSTRGIKPFLDLHPNVDLIRIGKFPLFLRHEVLNALLGRYNNFFGQPLGEEFTIRTRHWRARLGAVKES